METIMKSVRRVVIASLVLFGMSAATAAAQTERWIVHFKGRAPDLTALRQAILNREPAVVAGAVIADFDRTMRAEQAPFVAAVEKLGGKVSAQWWIVNACAVEIPAGLADPLRALPQVLRLERDVPQNAAGSDAHDKYNHNVDAVHLAGFNGAGSVLAILDGGFDIAMGASGRPHRVYFRGGDPGNTSGPGIAGSRLLFAKQMGAMPAGALGDHGTFVTSVSAGGGWGTQGSAPGNAFGADIAGYAIAELDDGGATSTSKVSAWQQVLVDRLQYPIAVANMSYHGIPDPLSAQNQAMDQASYTGDILIVCAAGNQGPGGTPNSESNANGLAVAAVRPDFHDLLGYSTRGPIAGDLQRSYPDISACVHTFVAWQDCETTDETFNGTSNASPQVAGVATLLRAAVPALTALQTKAILLASAADIAAANPAADRNGYGMGLLRADTALATAQDPGRFSSATLTTAAPIWSFPVSVVQGESYAVAIAWHRQVMTSSAWSNVDLQIVDGATVIGSSATPRNLYEVVRFTAPRSGTLQARVTGVSLEGGSQPVAIAVARGGSRPPVAGTFTGFGNSCGGSLGRDQVATTGGNVLARPADVDASSEVGGNYEVGFRVKPPNSTPITGVEFLVGVSRPVTAQLALYDTDSHKRPTGAPFRTASVAMSPQQAWHRWLFASPWQAPNNGRPVVVAITSSTTAHFTPGVAGATLPIYFRPNCGGPWGGPADFGLAVRFLVAGAGGGVEPILWNQGVPEVGRAFAVQLSRGVPNGSALLLLGMSRDVRNGVPLPIDLTPQGAPGCALMVSDDGSPWGGSAVIATSTDNQGEASVALAIPSSPSLVGITFYCQYSAIDPAANALGSSWSRGGAARIGVP
jgi:subtilisin family serine protease